MMKHSIRAIALLALLAGIFSTGGGISRADEAFVDFENPPYTPGPIHDQDGWKSSSAAQVNDPVPCPGPPLDHAVGPNTAGLPAFSTQSLRISNAVTHTCFDDQTVSKPLADEAGEPTAVSDGKSGGNRQQFFVAEWLFASATGAYQDGLSVGISPTRGDDSRMSFIRLDDTPGGIEVTFADVQGTFSPSNYVSTVVATGLHHAVPHSVRLEMLFVPGPSNDIVRVYVDGLYVHTGTSWENHFRFDSGATAPVGSTRTVDSLLFHTRGTAAPALAGAGFLFDNVKLFSGPVPDLSVSKTAPAPAIAGDVLTYTVTVENTGSVDMQSVELTDMMPAGTTIGDVIYTGGPLPETLTKFLAGFFIATWSSFPAGGVATFDVSVSLDPGLANNSTIKNTATVTSPSLDADPSNNSFTLITPVQASADLWIEKAGDATIDRGGTLTYTITVHNDGPSNARGVRVTDTTPAGTRFVSARVVSGDGWVLTAKPSPGGTGAVRFSNSLFKSGDTAVLEVQVKVNTNVASGTVIGNTASIGAAISPGSTAQPPNDPDNTNNVSGLVETTVN